ncbi:unnamed protein product [Acanthoscelides obtectus]|uniref:Uncharacterized protein n=1 Tax=Acanthoscelides obtectus TaxID=200917 RepID=A0A9P0P6S9_ACAOB|nr:unnamed protein product [Acanthoscelides obtectus]CAK1656674.1 hypothetical protein AOBTE_LOCUS19863 [Acanthoscelides obtectus]
MRPQHAVQNRINVALVQNSDYTVLRCSLRTYLPTVNVANDLLRLFVIGEPLGCGPPFHVCKQHGRSFKFTDFLLKKTF